MSGRHDELTLLAPAYALGALDPDERREFEEHLGSCEVCSAEVRSLSRIASGLAQTPVQVSPRPELRGRVLSAVGATGAIRPAQPPPGVRARSASAAAVWLPYAAMLALAAGFALYARDQRNDIRSLSARVEQAEESNREAQRELEEAARRALQAQATIDVMTAPDLLRFDLAGQGDAKQASARAYWSRQRGMVFSGANLPPLPPGRVYQVWVITSDPAPISAGLLGADGSGMFMTPPDIAPPKLVAVTSEPAGGASAPTTTPFLVGAGL
jgi:anti-sigma-K factor RskA